MTNAPRDSSSANRIRRALDEVRANRNRFSEESYLQIVVALEDKLRRQTSENAVITPADDEVRLVSVMFIDVVDSTSIARALDAEDWHALIGRAHRFIGDVISRWDGEIGQYLGDGMLCFYGARRSQGNDATRAIASALDVQAQVASFAASIAQEYPSLKDFKLRVGISTGQVIVGMIGTGDKSEVLAVGTTTNLAARLQTLCPPGGVAVDAETYHRAREDFQFTPYQTDSVKGFDGTVAYYLVTGRQPRALNQITTAQVGAITVPFIDRANTLIQIRERMQHVARYRSFRALTILGAVGMGKTRLLQTVIHSPDADAFAVVPTRAQYEDRSRDYNLLREMLAHLCDLSPNEPAASAEAKITAYTRTQWDNPAAEATAAVVGYLGGYGFQNSPYAASLHRSTHDTGGRSQIQEWVHWWLRGIAGGKPVLLAVDNLQWADAESLALLQSLITIDSGLMILAASRPEFKDERPLYMRGVPYHSTITLAPFTLDDTRQLIQAVLQPVEQVPPTLYQTIHQRAEGTPLFIEEYLRMLFENGVFEQIDPDTWRVNRYRYRTVEDTLPGGLLGVLQARLDELPNPARRAVQIASIMGQTFWRGIVTAIGGIEAQAALDDLVQRNIIVQHADSRLANDVQYGFSNTLYQEVAYAMLTRSHRTLYHHQAAVWLANQLAAHPTLGGLLAEQHAKAEEPEKALDAYVSAAAFHITRGLLADVLSLVDAGLSAAGEVPRAFAVPRVIRLWLMKAQALHARRRYAEATAAADSALRLAAELPDDALRSERIQASVTLGNAHTSLGNHRQAMNALTEAYENLNNTVNAVQQAAVLRAFGMLFWTRGNLDEATMYLMRSVSATEPDGPPRERAAGRSMLGRIALDKGAFDQALDIFKSVHDINITEQNYLYQIMDLRMMGTIYRHLFAYEQALASLDEAEALCQRINYEDLLLQTNRGLCYIGQGRADDGLRLLNDVIDNVSLNVYDRYEVQLDYIQGVAQTGRFDACVSIATEFVETVEHFNPLLKARGMLWLGMSLYQLGDTAPAHHTLQQALHIEMRAGGQYLWLCHYALSVLLGDEPQGRLHRGQALDILNSIANSLSSRPALRAALKDPAHFARFFQWLAPTHHK